MSLSTKLSWPLASSKWAAEINPVLANPQNNSNLLQNLVLKSGVTVINHKLGRMQQGWVLADVQGPATIYRSAPYNDKTLQLTSSADVTISLGVF